MPTTRSSLAEKVKEVEGLLLRLRERIPLAVRPDTLAAALDVSPATVRWWIKTRRIPFSRVHPKSDPLIIWDDILALLKHNRVKAEDWPTTSVDDIADDIFSGDAS